MALIAVLRAMALIAVLRAVALLTLFAFVAQGLQVFFRRGNDVGKQFVMQCGDLDFLPDVMFDFWQRVDVFFAGKADSGT